MGAGFSRFPLVLGEAPAWSPDHRWRDLVAEGSPVDLPELEAAVLPVGPPENDAAAEAASPTEDGSACGQVRGA